MVTSHQHPHHPYPQVPQDNTLMTCPCLEAVLQLEDDIQKKVEEHLTLCKDKLFFRVCVLDKVQDKNNVEMIYQKQNICDIMNMEKERWSNKRRHVKEKYINKGSTWTPVPPESKNI